MVSNIPPFLYWLVGLYLIIFSVLDLVKGSTNLTSHRYLVDKNEEETSNPIVLALLISFHLSLGTGFLFFSQDPYFFFSTVLLPLYISLVIGILFSKFYFNKPKKEDNTNDSIKEDNQIHENI